MFPRNSTEVRDVWKIHCRSAKTETNAAGWGLTI